MAARKRSGMKTSHYLISKSKDDLERKSENYLGTVRSNFMGTGFNVWDEGEKYEKHKKNPEKYPHRKQLAHIIYVSAAY